METPDSHTLRATSRRPCPVPQNVAEPVAVIFLEGIPRGGRRPQEAHVSAPGPTFSRSTRARCASCSSAIPTTGTRARPTSTRTSSCRRRRLHPHGRVPHRSERLPALQAPSEWRPSAGRIPRVVQAQTPALTPFGLAWPGPAAFNDVRVRRRALDGHRRQRSRHGVRGYGLLAAASPDLLPGRQSDGEDLGPWFSTVRPRPRSSSRRRSPNGFEPRCSTTSTAPDELTVPARQRS